MYKNRDGSNDINDVINRASSALGNGTVHTVYRLCLNRHRLGTPPSDVTFRHSLQRCAVIFSPLFCYDT